MLTESKIKEKMEQIAEDLACPAVSKYYILEYMYYYENKYVKVIYFWNVLIFFLLLALLSVCSVNGNAGDGTKQGDCNTGYVCSADGTCNGRLRLLSVWPSIMKSYNMIHICNKYTYSLNREMYQ